jgi:uncharacterized phiE125 gp8 family phage protein
LPSGRITTGESVLVDRLPYGTNPKVLPVESQTLRDHLIVSHNADDTIILGVGGYLHAATVEVENRGNVSLISQQRRQYIGVDDYPVACKSFALGFGPVQSITAVMYLDEDDVEQTYPATSYRYSHGDIYFKEDPPTLADGPNTIWVDYVAGYGDTPSAVDSLWQNIVMQIAFRKYELRGESPGQTPDAWERMIDRQIVIAGGSRRGL